MSESRAARIAEQITKGWWDVPAIETREECVAALTQLVQAVLDEESDRVAIVGSRRSSPGGGFTKADADREQACTDYVKALPKGMVVVTGAWWHGDRLDATSGIDRCAALAARDAGHTVCLVAGSPLHGRAAGMIRNLVVVDIARRVKAFWDGRSPGTKRTMDLATFAGKLL